MIVVESLIWALFWFLVGYMVGRLWQEVHNDTR